MTAISFQMYSDALWRIGQLSFGRLYLAGLPDFIARNFFSQQINTTGTDESELSCNENWPQHNFIMKLKAEVIKHGEKCTLQIQFSGQEEVNRLIK